MPLGEIVKVAFAKPFRPFRFHLADGMKITIGAWDQCYVGKSRTRVSTWMSDDKEMANMREVDILNDRIVSVEYLD